VFLQLNKWFDANLLSLNYDKTQYIHFTPKGTFFHDSIIGYNNKFISVSTNTTYLGMIIENTLSWKAHIDQLISKLCMACYAIRTVKPFVCQEHLNSVYYSYFHSLITYGVIWGNSSHTIHVFRLQKRVIRIITGSRPRDSCTQLFKKLGILPLISQYILPLLLFIVKNKALFQLNSKVHSINTRYKSNLHSPLVNLTTYKKGTYCVGIKIFNDLPTDIKHLSHNGNQFRLTLSDFLHLNSFYTLEEYFNSSNNSLSCL
jgi:hypothetical protein